jgi:hypothetical protein
MWRLKSELDDRRKGAFLVCSSLQHGPPHSSIPGCPPAFPSSPTRGQWSFRMSILHVFHPQRKADVLQRFPLPLEGAPALRISYRIGCNPTRDREPYTLCFSSCAGYQHERL